MSTLLMVVGVVGVLEEPFSRIGDVEDGGGGWDVDVEDEVEAKGEEDDRIVPGMPRLESQAPLKREDFGGVGLLVAFWSSTGLLWSSPVQLNQVLRAVDDEGSVAFVDGFGCCCLIR